jgi:hypothetical protein
VGLNWGDIPTWVAGVGTVLAFFGTLAVIRRDRARDRERHEEELWDQALAVDAEFDAVLDDGYKAIKAIKAQMNNGGRRPIFDVHVNVMTKSSDDVVARSELSQLPAKARWSIPLPSPDDIWGEWGGGRYLYPGSARDVLEGRFSWVILWVDTAGRRWMRSSYRILNKVSDKEWPELVSQFRGGEAEPSEQAREDEGGAPGQTPEDEAAVSEKAREDEGGAPGQDQGDQPTASVHSPDDGAGAIGPIGALVLILARPADDFISQVRKRLGR